MTPETTLETGRVTAGLPSLDPSRRFQHDKHEAQTHKIRSIHAEVEAKRADAVSPDGGRDRTDKQQSVGIPLHSAQIIDKLSRLNPSLSFRHHPFMTRFQIFVRDDKGTNGERYVCAFEDGYSPQFEIFLWHWEEHVFGYGAEAYLENVKVLDETVRGWVTLIDILIKQKLITKAGAEREFPYVHSRAHQRNTAGY